MGILARTVADVHAVAAQVRRQGRVALPVPADVTQSAEVQQAMRILLDDFGVLDVLVNNAGTGMRRPFCEMTPREWDSLIDLNFRGLLHCTAAALPHMQARRQGCILNIASQAGRQPEPNLAVYSATKAAVIAFSQGLASEVGEWGIRIITVCPGPVDTARIRREAPNVDRSGWLTPEDVARAVVPLVSDPTRGRNGAVIDLFASGEDCDET
jgi:short-subunit dehydrogenase